MSKRKIYIISAFVLIIILLVAAVFAWNQANRQEVSTDTPANIVLDFYMPWLQAAKAVETDPYQAGLANSPILSKELRKRLQNGRVEGEVDPVLCQSAVPDKVAARILYELQDKVEILVTARPTEFSTEQAIVTLLSRDGGWYIDAIRCAPGEFGPEVEFAFDREGSLIKSVPEPLNSENWHFIYEESDELGHFVPLFFNSESSCRTQGGEAAVCNPDTFVEASKARIQGEMTEAGLTVKNLEFKR